MHQVSGNPGLRAYIYVNIIYNINAGTIFVLSRQRLYRLSPTTGLAKLYLVLIIVVGK